MTFFSSFISIYLLKLPSHKMRVHCHHKLGWNVDEVGVNTQQICSGYLYLRKYQVLSTGQIIGVIGAFWWVTFVWTWQFWSHPVSSDHGQCDFIFHLKVIIVVVKKQTNKQNTNKQKQKQNKNPQQNGDDLKQENSTCFKNCHTKGHITFQTCLLWQFKSSHHIPSLRSNT